MASTRARSDIPIQEDMRFQRRAWALQRFGRLLLFCFVAAGMFGFFGGGGVVGSTRTSSAGEKLTVEHRRFLRKQSEADLVVRMSGDLVRDQRVTLWIEQGWLEAFELEHVVPRPAAMRAGEGRLALEFDVDGAPPELAVDLQLRTRRAGPKSGQIGVVGGPAVRVNLFIYP